MAKICNLAEYQHKTTRTTNTDNKIKQIYGGFYNGIENNTKRNGNY